MQYMAAVFMRRCWRSHAADVERSPAAVWLDESSDVTCPASSRTLKPIA